MSPNFKADIRKIDQANAIRILRGVHRFAENAEGDVIKLQGNSGELRLRIGDYRVRFNEDEGTITLHSASHRSKAY